MAESTQPPAARRTGWLDQPWPDRFSADRQDYESAMQAHRSAVAGGSPGYLDPATGLFVMTAQYLHERGWCCDRGCRHCPYVGARTESHDENESEQSHE